MNRRAFLLTAIYSAAAMILLKIKGGQAAAVGGDDPVGQLPMGVPYTVAADPPKRYTFIPAVTK